jgi:hypothetical protein
MRPLLTLLTLAALILGASAASAQALTTTATFQAGHSGFWYSPEASGSGFALTVDEAGVLGVAAYTFSPNTLPQLLPGQSGGDYIELANHVFLVGAAPTAYGHPRVVVPLFLPIDGSFFGDGAESVEYGRVALQVLDCDAIAFDIELWSGLPLAAPELVPSRASGVLRKLTGPEASCVLDCPGVDFGPRPPHCPAD